MAGSRRERWRGVRRAGREDRSEGVAKIPVQYGLHLSYERRGE